MKNLTMSNLANMCAESRDADIPTPLEFAFSLLNDANFEEEWATELIQHEDNDGLTQFEEGWRAGFYCDLDISCMPSNHEDMKSTRAWLVGFIGGQFALANGYDHDEF